jgi:hypothetical protein
VTGWRVSPKDWAARRVVRRAVRLLRRVKPGVVLVVVRVVALGEAPVVKAAAGAERAPAPVAAQGKPGLPKHNPRMVGLAAVIHRRQISAAPTPGPAILPRVILEAVEVREPAPRQGLVNQAHSSTSHLAAQPEGAAVAQRRPLAAAAGLARRPGVAPRRLLVRRKVREGWACPLVWRLSAPLSLC